MRSNRRHIALLVFLAALSAACTTSANAQADECSPAAFEKDGAVACSKLMAHFHRYQQFDAQKKFPEALAELDAILAFPAAVTRAESITFHPNFGQERVSLRTGAGLHRAITLNAMGRTAEAADVLNQFVEEDPRALTLALRAANHRSQGSASEADILADVEKAIAQDPTHWYPRELRARMHIDAKRYDTAAEDFLEAIKLAPNRGSLRWGRAMVLRQLGRVDEATNYALVALDVDPDYFVNNKLQALYRRGYLQSVSDDNLMPAMREAVRACLLDERCW